MHPRNAEREVVPVVDESVWLAANRLRLLQSQSDCQTRLIVFFFGLCVCIQSKSRDRCLV